jgi:pimeloyl-ACP methyl ester carboxylesterase
VVRFDNRDVGLSTKFSEAGYPDLAAIGKALEDGKPAPLPYTLEDMAEDAVGLLEALNIPKAHIVGVSMGGGIAQLVAINHPQRTLSLTSIMADSGNPALPLIAKPEALAGLPTPPVDGDKETFIDYQSKLWQVLGSPDYPTDEQTIRELVRRDVERSYDPAGLARHQAVALFGHFDVQRYANLKSIVAPTVVLQGADDPLVPVEAARDIAANIPGAELIIVPGMGHELPTQLVLTIADAITSAAERAINTKE